MRRPRGRARRGFVALLRSLVPAKKRRSRRRRVRLRGRLHLPGPFSIAAGLVLGGVILAAVVGAGRIAGIGPGGRTDLRPPEGLPSLPVLPQQFAGVTLERYLRPPAVHVDHVDALLSSPVLADAEFTEAVHWWVTYWTVYATRWFPGYLERMADRGEDVDRAVLAYGFPPSLRYLPLIESGYDPRVTSRSGAVGLWQLMPTTARGLGLTVSPVLDERRDADKSTRAALRYIRTLNTEFESWFLTLAAYNYGPTRVRAVLRRHAPDAPRTDSLFWALRNRFPIETREFLPKLYGAMFVASRPDAYGYGPEGEDAMSVLRTLGSGAR